MEMKAGTVITVLGEAMLELSHGDGDSWNLRYGGDVINTAVHLARFGDKVRLASALGTDPMSAHLIAQWQAEGVDTQLVLAAACPACMRSRRMPRVNAAFTIGAVKRPRGACSPCPTAI